MYEHTSAISLWYDKRDYSPFLPKIKQLSMRREGVERASALASLISWIMVMGLEFPMVRSELNFHQLQILVKGQLYWIKKMDKPKE